MLGKCWRFWDFPMSLWQHPQDFPDFLKPIIQVPEILGMLKHMGEETREALSDGQVAEVQAQKVRDRSWVDLEDQLSGYVRCWIFWRSTQLVCCQRGPSESKLLDCRPVAGFSGVSRPFRCKDQRNQSCWAWELTSCRSCRKKPFEIPKSLWGPYSNCRRKDGTARGVESGSALRGPFRDFGFAWHGFVDLFLLAL